MPENRCQICGRLYPAEVQSCDDCHVFLRSADAPASNQPDASPPHSLVRLVNLPYIEALVLADVLRSQGIYAVLPDDLLINATLGDTPAAFGGVSILVDPADRDHALEILKLQQEGKLTLPEDQLPDDPGA